MDGSAIVGLCGVYHQPPRQNLIGHPQAARMDLLPGTVRRLGDGLRHMCLSQIDLCSYGNRRCTAIADALRNSISSLKSAACP
jgi:hypothetical protein